jgi:hypothetical protein
MIGSRHVQCKIIKHQQPRRLPVAPGIFGGRLAGSFRRTE